MVFTCKCRDIIATANDNFIGIDMDNNQRCQCKKQQREGTCNNFIVVTHSIAIKSLDTTPNHVNTLPGATVSETPRNRVECTYQTSDLPPPVGCKKSNYDDLYREALKFIRASRVSPSIWAG